MKRFELSLLIAILFCALTMNLTIFAKDCSDVRESVVRLHILANSNTDSDQSLKLAVRDRVLRETESVFTTPVSKQQAKQNAQNALPQIIAIAEDEILRQGYSYPVTGEIVNMYFETRVYDGFTMPAGQYDAVRLYIGEAKGKNWWCVMYPPMCIPSAVQNEEEQKISDKITDLSATPTYKPKFAIVELFEKIRNTLNPPTHP